jgi:hypothetical protein
MNEFVYARHFNNKDKKSNVNGNQMFQWKKNDIHLNMNMICNKLKPIARYNLMYAKNFNNKDEKEQCKWKSNVPMAKKDLHFNMKMICNKLKPIVRNNLCT